MIKQTITYEDYDGRPCTEDFYFNLDKVELLEMEIGFDGGLSSYIEELNQTTAGAEAYELFKKVILKAYGKKSPDGKKFWKEDPDTGRKYAPEFVASPAMSALIFGFLEDGNDASAFIRGLMPSRMIAEVEAEAAKTSDNAVVAVSSDPVTPTDTKKEKKPEDYTEAELLAMPKDEFFKLVGDNPQKMHPTILPIAFRRKTES